MMVLAIYKASYSTHFLLLRRAAGTVRDELLCLLRILRNTCACGAETTKKLIDRGVSSHAAGVLQKTGTTLVSKPA